MEEKKRGNPFLILFREEWKNLGNRKPIYFFYLILFVIASAISLMHPLLIGIIFNSIQEEITTNAQMFELIKLIFLILIIEIGFWIFHGFGRVIEELNAFHVYKNYKNEKIRRVLALPLKWHKDHHSGDTIDKLEKGSSAISSYSSNVTYQLVYAVMGLFGSVIILLFFDIVSAIVAFIFSLIVIFFITRIDKILIKRYRETNKINNKESASVYDYIGNITTILTLRLKGTVRKEIDKRIQASYDPIKRAAKLQEIKWSIVDISLAVMVVALLSYRAYTDFNSTGTIMIVSLSIIIGFQLVLQAMQYDIFNAPKSK